MASLRSRAANSATDLASGSIFCILAADDSLPLASEKVFLQLRRCSELSWLNLIPVHVKCLFRLRRHFRKCFLDVRLSAQETWRTLMVGGSAIREYRIR